MMDCVFSGSLLVVFSLFCYAVCFFEQINSLSPSMIAHSRAVTRKDTYARRSRLVQ